MWKPVANLVKLRFYNSCNEIYNICTFEVHPVVAAFEKDFDVCFYVFF